MSGWDKESRRYLVSGRVQGVGYRAFAARACHALGITGGARNLDDGKVEIVGTGPVHALERLESALLEGPRFARVDDLRTEVLPGPAPTDDFDVEF